MTGLRIISPGFFDKRKSLGLAILVGLVLFSTSLFSQKLNSEWFDLNLKISIRAMEVVNDSTLWFSANRGIVGYTEDNGRHWQIDSIKIDSLVPDFRSIAVTQDGIVCILNAGSPAFLFRSSDKGKHWKKVYSNTNKDVFFDSMKFRDKKNGLAISDPVDSSFLLIQTKDGGATWSEIPGKKLPSPLKGEACFASSNSCIDVFGNNIWIATGGIHSRILHSPDWGNTWKAYETPVMQGGQMTGIFSMDFYNETIGFIAGGNYDSKKSAARTQALTKDKGQSWYLVPEINSIGFGNCVQYVPGSLGKELLQAGSPGVYHSIDGGQSWYEITDLNGNPFETTFNTLRISPSAKTAWLAGTGGKLLKLTLKK